MPVPPDVRPRCCACGEEIDSRLKQAAKANVKAA